MAKQDPVDGDCGCEGLPPPPAIVGVDTAGDEGTWAGPLPVDGVSRPAPTDVGLGVLLDVSSVGEPTLGVGTLTEGLGPPPLGVGAAGLVGDGADGLVGEPPLLVGEGTDGEPPLLVGEGADGRGCGVFVPGRLGAGLDGCPTDGPPPLGFPGVGADGRPLPADGLRLGRSPPPPPPVVVGVEGGRAFGAEIDGARAGGMLIEPSLRTK